MMNPFHHERPFSVEAGDTMARLIPGSSAGHSRSRVAWPFAGLLVVLLITAAPSGSAALVAVGGIGEILSVRTVSTGFPWKAGPMSIYMP